MSQELTIIGSQIFLCVKSGFPNEIVPNIDYKLCVYEIKLNEHGNLDFQPIEFISLFTPSDSSYTTISMNFIDQTNEWLIAQAYPLQANKQRFRFLLTDEQFNIESTRYLDTAGVVNVHFNVSSFYGHTYGLGTILGPPADQLMYMDYDHSNKGVLPSIKIGQTSPYHSTFITSIIADSVTNHVIAFYYNGIQEIDSNFNQIQNHWFFEINTELYGQIIRYGDYFYSHGLYRTGMNGFKLLLLQKYDSLFQIITSDTLGDRSHDNWPFVIESMDSKNGEILVGGHLDGPFSHFDVYSSIKKFYLAKYDTLLNRIWYKEYGGDRAYWMTGLKILPDESIMAYGFITDTVDGFRHAYVLHVAENGDLISSTELYPQDYSNVQLINEGNGIFSISNTENLQLQLIVFDQKGINILNRIISDNNSTIDLSALPAAGYFYSIANKSKVIASGKLIKID